MFQDVVQRGECPPLVICGAIENWSPRRWSVAWLADLLGNRPFTCKIASQDHTVVEWETESMHMSVTLSEYAEWLDKRPSATNPLRHVDPDKFSCYIDYKYLREMVKDHPHLLKDVDWSLLGLAGRDGTDSTIWIGSAGAYTPCHYDTYGFNLVAQLSGKKRWYLFPPACSENMYPTRIPYEESSVFSEVNIRSPDHRKHPDFQCAEPYIVDLMAGEVLYVPQHWWHFVECLEASVSINTWVPLASDSESHLQESMCRLLFSSLAPELLSPDQLGACLNTGEDIQESCVNIQYVQTAVSQCLKDPCLSSQPNWFKMFTEKFRNKRILYRNDTKPHGKKRRYSESEQDLDQVDDQSRERIDDQIMIFALRPTSPSEYRSLLKTEYGYVSKGFEEDLISVKEHKQNSRRSRENMDNTALGEQVLTSPQNPESNVIRNDQTEDSHKASNILNPGDAGECVKRQHLDSDDSDGVRLDANLRKNFSISGSDILKATLHPCVINLVSKILLKEGKMQVE